MDITDPKGVEEAPRASEERFRTLVLARPTRGAQAELAHVTRATTLGEVTASIAHEVSTSRSSCWLRWLAAERPNLELEVGRA
jgi:hypothetical protein